MPKRFLARVAGTGLRALGGVISGAGTLVQKVAAKPTTDKPHERPRSADPGRRGDR